MIVSVWAFRRYRDRPVTGWIRRSSAFSGWAKEAEPGVVLEITYYPVARP